MGAEARVASAGPHHGEERALRGEGGSGTIFLAGCSLGCLYCQNWEISHEREGRAAGTRRIADLMLGLQAEGCHNINWVTPTHAMASLVEALDLAAAEGLKVPLVYNSSAYERVESLRLLDGVVDIYLPDIKFFDLAASRRWLTVEDYGEVSRAALLEMYRQVGDLVVDTRRLAASGVLIRHLVMPGYGDDAREILRWIHGSLSARASVNVMGQYRPGGAAPVTGPLSAPPTLQEIAMVKDYARALGLRLLVD